MHVQDLSQKEPLAERTTSRMDEEEGFGIGELGTETEGSKDGNDHVHDGHDHDHEEVDVFLDEKAVAQIIGVSLELLAFREREC